MEINPADLRRVNVFREATDQDLKLIAERSIPRSIEEGGFFFFQGDPSRYLYILTAGRAKLLQTSAAGQQVNLRIISPWEMFGALGAVRGEEAGYPATAEAIEPCTALALESSVLREMMQTRPYIAAGLMELMTGYIQEMQDRYRELATERVQRRIARAVLRLTQQIGAKNTGGQIELAFSRQELAEITGTTLFTVSRTLSEWERLGLVEAGRERVVILDPHGLVRLSEDFSK